MKNNKFPVSRIVFCAICIALYNLLALLSIPLGPLKITVEALPVIICAVAFGPWDAAIVAGLAELLNQILTYGLTPTTVLWMLPGIARGLILGFGMLPFVRKNPFPSKDRTQMIAFYALCLVGAVAVSLLNTLTLYVDSKMFGYYSYELVLGSLVLRILTGLASTTLMAVAAVPVVAALRKVRLVK